MVTANIKITIMLLVINWTQNSILQDSVKSSPTFECLNRNDPSKMTPKAILKEFAKGPCSPLMIFPALLSTKIVLQIDCKALLADNKDMFDTCGWNACEKQWFEFWKIVPNTEYQIWVPKITGPMSIFQFDEYKNMCWANFMKLSVDTTKPFEDAVIQQKGFTIKVFGFTPLTGNQAECGDGSNKNLLGYDWIEVKKTKYLKSLYDKLYNMGYTAGLTYQTLPYDFRLSYRANEVNKLFKSNLDRIFTLTGKKVVLVGHSLGNVNIYHQLLKLDTETKQKMIKTWVSVSSAVAGALQAFNSILAGDSEFMYFKNLVGIHYHAEIEAFNSIISGYELLPIDFFTHNKDEGWVKAMEKRIAYEQGINTFKDSGFSFLPRIEDKCSPSNFQDYPTDCRMGFFDYRKEFIIKIKDNEYKVNEVEQMLSKYHISDNTMDMYRFTRDDRMHKLPNPEVPVVSINLRTGKTVQRYIYDKEFIEYLHSHDYPQANTTIGYGDGVLSSTTQMAGPLKWAFEYDSKTANSHPVKLIDVCSTYNLKNDVYDIKDVSKPFEMINNEFIGVTCECIKNKNTEDCNHPNMIIDDHVQNFMLGVLRSNEKSFSAEYAKYIDSLDDFVLVNMITVCPQLTTAEPFWNKVKIDEGLTGIVE